MKKYNHAYTVGFCIESDNTEENVTEKELLEGLAKKLADMINDHSILDNAECFDSFDFSKTCADSPSYFKMLEMFKKHMINPRKTQEIKMNKLAGGKH